MMTTDLQGGCHGCGTRSGCAGGLLACRHSRTGWTYQPDGGAVTDRDGRIVVELDPHVATDLTAAERAALGEWIAQGGPAVIAAAGAAAGTTARAPEATR